MHWLLVALLALAVPQARHRPVKIKFRPGPSAATVGELRPGGAAQLTGREVPGHAHGHGCSRWLEVEPLGYLCRDQVRIDERPGARGRGPEPSRRSYRYAVVRSERAPLFQKGAVADWLRRGDGVTVLARGAGPVPTVGTVRTAAHFSMPQEDLSVVAPPALEAADLAGLPPAQRYSVAFLVAPPDRDDVPVLAAGAGGEPAPGRWPRYARVQVTGPGADPRAGRIAVRSADGRDGEVDAACLRRVEPAPLPADLGPKERWIDVALGQQVAVAYEGPEPLFATLVSTAAHQTPPGTFYINRKYRAHTMASLKGASARYDFRDVPHAQFFAGRIGLHAVLWHDRLGYPVSHGCVNLSPADAARFFAFTEPALPSGWHAIYTPPESELRGTRVVVRK